MRLAVCVPTSGRVTATFAYALAQTVGFFGTWEATERLKLLVQQSSSIHSNREQLVEQALEWDATHVLFIDDDMFWTPQAVLSLLGRQLAFVACNYVKRSFPIEFVSVDMHGNRIATTEESTGVVECQFSGFGVSLIRAEVFRALSRPWFLPGYSHELKEYSTEDMPLYIAARAAGFIPHIDHDASKMGIFHVGEHQYAWNQRATMEPA